MDAPELQDGYFLESGGHRTKKTMLVPLSTVPIKPNLIESFLWKTH